MTPYDPDTVEIGPRTELDRYVNELTTYMPFPLDVCHPPEVKHPTAVERAERWKAERITTILNGGTVPGVTIIDEAKVRAFVERVNGRRSPEHGEIN